MKLILLIQCNGYPYTIQLHDHVGTIFCSPQNCHLRHALCSLRFCCNKIQKFRGECKTLTFQKWLLVFHPAGKLRKGWILVKILLYFE